jgi:photosystem II stability/assembly factor-like uncharacterized protein
MIKLFTLFLFLFVVILSPVRSQLITWIPTNQSLTGNINDLAHQSGTIYAGTIAGVHKSNDLGQSWQLSNSGLLNTKVFAFAVKNENEIFCGTQGGVFYSADKGGSWVERNNGLLDKFITTLYYKGGDTIFAGTLYTGMFMSPDGGKKWDSVAGEFSTKAVNAISIRHSGEIYVGTTSGLYRSDSKGKNFIAMTNNLPDKQNVYSITIRSNGIVFFGTRDGQIWRTTNNGNSWTKQLDLKANIQIYNIFLTKTGAILASTYGNGIYRSNDNGDTWQQINNGLNNKLVMALVQHLNGNYFAATWGSGVFLGYEPPISTIASGAYCAGSAISVDYKINSFTFDSGNEFIVQLSEPDGTFTKLQEIGKIQAINEGRINCVLPESLKSGKGYKVRVVSTKPIQVSAASEDIEINALPGTKIVGKTRVCTNGIEKYGVKFEENVQSEWFVTGGNVKTPKNTDTIEVEWHYSEDALVMLIRKNTTTGCIDTSFVNIKYWPTPQKPTITRMSGFLVSSANTGNQWYRNGVLIDGETSKELELKGIAGLYTVQVTDSNGCISVLSDIFDFNVNSVDNKNFYYGVTVYPIPAMNTINAEITLNMPAQVKAEIYNLQGEKLDTKELGILDSRTINKIELDNLIEGTYYIKFIIGSEISLRRIVVVR